MDRRAFASLALGLAGLAAGVVAAFIGWAMLAVLAGACALAAAALALGQASLVHHRGREITSLKEAVSLQTAEITRLQEAAYAGREAIQAAGNFAEMVAMRNLELAELAGPEGLLDEATGLLDGRYFQAALDQRVAAARRQLRPVTLVLLQLEEGELGEGEARDNAVGMFGKLVRRTLREADTACRIDNSCFGIVLEDTPEGGGVWAAERIRGVMAREGGPVQALSAGVASYPTHALDAKDLLDRAQHALTRARGSGRGRVEVAPVE
jgi:diguanylate cyclase (GGDEF)-like protein